jgi:photosystem II stability/assembly factor-like uncharacterized protein
MYANSGSHQPIATLPDAPIPAAPHVDPLHALVASPDVARDGRCYAARQSGLYLSDDAGETWRPALGQTAGATPTVTCVAFAPSEGEQRVVFAGALGGVMRSRDRGQTWRVAVLPSPPPLVSCLVVSPAFAEDGVLVAGTVEDGIIHSNDRGESWRRWNFGLLDLSVLALAISPAFAADETLFAGTETALFVSTNGGRAWKESGFPPDAASVLSLAISPHYVIDGVILAGTERHGLWRSADRGGSWERIDDGRLADAVNQVVVASTDVLVALPEEVLLSRDGGGSWSVVCEERAGGGIAAVATPEELVSRAVILVGRRDGSLRRVTIRE